MPTLTVRDIPDAVYELLHDRSDRHRRSMSSEIVTILEETLLPSKVQYDRFLIEARSFHDRFEQPLPDRISQGIEDGRKFDSPKSP